MDGELSPIILGAVCGDVIGSTFECSRWSGATFDTAVCGDYFHRQRGVPRTGARASDFELVPPGSEATDDSLLTGAVTAWILDGGSITEHLVYWFRKNPDAGFSTLFRQWAEGGGGGECGSTGNGAAMRVSPVGAAYDDEAEVISKAREQSRPTHQVDHAVEGAEVMAVAVFSVLNGVRNAALQDRLRPYGYDLTRAIDASRDGFEGATEAPKTVPYAIRAFLESAGYEETIRRAVSLGGDADTIASMAGALAGARWGVPESIASLVVPLLDPELVSIMRRFEQRYPSGRRVSSRTP